MTRALITERERERIAEDEQSQARYQAISRVRKRIDKLDDDLDALRTHHPDLYEELLQTVAPDTGGSDTRDSRQKRIQRAADVLEGVPADPENDAVQNWAAKVDVTPREIAAALDG